MRIKFYFFLLLNASVALPLFAQSTLTGIVLSGEGRPLAGASVSIEKLSLHTATNADGKYTLALPDKATGANYMVKVSYVGYITDIKPITLSAGSQALNFTLQADYHTLKGVEVSALKSKTTLAAETPMSITVFKGSYIESISAHTLGEFIQQAPGVTTTQLDEAYMAVQIRGISSFSGDSPAGYYLDDLPFSFIGSPLVPDINPFDLNQVEVLRGPQGTLYGNGGESGVVRVLTKDADLTKFELKLDASTASTKNGGPDYGYQGAVNLPVIKNKLALRLVGGYLDNGGFLTNNLLGRTNINQSKLGYFRAKVNYQATDRLDIRASFWTQKNNVGTNSLADKNFDHSTPFDEANNNDINLFSTTIEYKLPTIHFYSTTSYTKLDATQNDGSPIFALSATQLGQKASSEEFRVSSVYNGPFNWLAGFYYWNGTFNQKTDIVLSIPGGLFTQPYLQTKSNSTDYSGFGELYYRFLDNKMQATAGLRYFSEKRDLEDFTPSTVALLQSLNIPAKRGTSYHLFAPRFNLAYNPSKHAMVYATAANGFRSGFVQSGSFFGSAVAFGIPAPEYVNNENLWSYELGTKLTSNNNRFLVEAAVYYNDWRNLIQSTSQIVTIGGAPTPIIYFLNAGKASAKGIDATTQYTTPFGLTLTLGGNINQSHYDQDTPPAIGAKKGDRISFVPKYNYTASANYTHPVSASLKGTVYASVLRTAERIDYNNGVTFKGDPITMLNARAGVEAKNWGLYLFGNNLSNDRGATYPSSALTYYTRLRPRTLGIDLKLNY